MSYVSLLIIAMLMLGTCTPFRIGLKDPCPGGNCKPTINCDVAIAGGGMGGVYTAYRLVQLGYSGSICVVEKEKEVGGRLKVVKLANGYEIDVGGTRVNVEHYDMLRLASELNVTMELGDYATDGMFAILARDKVALSYADIRSVFPRASSNVDGWDVIMDTSSNYYFNAVVQDTYSYVMGYYKSEEDMAYFMSTFRFRGDFEAVDRKTYTEFTNQDAVSAENWYPNSGMQQFVTKMAERLKGTKVIIRTGESIQKINRWNSDVTRYTVESDQAIYVTKRLIIALPPVALNKVSGNIIDQLQLVPQYNQSKPVPVFVAVMRWDTRWWEGLSTARRLWTGDNCIILMEEPITPGRIAANAFRSIYSDGHCAEEWKSIHTIGGKDLVIKTWMNNAQYFYPNATIPAPVETHIHYWDDAWYFEQPGAPYSLTEKAKWAMYPFKNEQVYMVGEAYNPTRTWAQGACQSSDNAIVRFMNSN